MKIRDIEEAMFFEDGLNKREISRKAVHKDKEKTSEVFILRRIAQDSIHTLEVSMAARINSKQSSSFSAHGLRNPDSKRHDETALLISF